MKHLVKIVCALFVLVFSMHFMRRAYPLPYPHFGDLLLTRGENRDVVGIMLGFRGTMADLAWIDMLQYIGGGVLPDEDPNRNYDLMKYFSQRVIRIDPYFHKAVLYGANILAWFNIIDRPDEALELLHEAQSNDPQYWPYKALIAAILFKKDKMDEKSLAVLEQALRQEDCPLMIKNILANIYKKKGDYINSLRVWDVVYQTGDAYQKEYALRQMEIIKNLLITRNSAGG